MEIDREMIKRALQNLESCNQIAASRGMSHNTVRRAKKLAEAAGLTPESLEVMSDSELKHILYPGRRNTKYIYPNCEKEVEDLNKGYSLQEAHARYAEEVGETAAIGYSAYCDKIRDYRNTLRTEFRHSHVPGEELQIDYGGKRPTGREDGKSRKFELFVAVFPASHYLFAVCTRTQSTADTIEASVKALEFFEGVPMQIVSDNLKAVVISNGRGNPVINRQYLAFADHYNTRIAPTRVASPTDKASVEVGVKLVQNKFNARLRDRPPLELSELNTILRSVVDDLNSREMKRGGETRKQRFIRLDKPELRRLPTERITYIELPAERRVPPSYHVSVDNVHYSVPSELVGKKVLVRKSPETIEIRHDGLPIVIHRRSYRKDSFVTVEAHRPDNHQAFVEIKFNKWKDDLPAPVREIVEIEFMSTHPGRERLTKRVRRLEKHYGRGRLINACTQALKNQSPNLKHVTNLLRNKLEHGAKESPLPNSSFDPQENVRGSEYFDRDIDGLGDAA